MKTENLSTLKIHKLTQEQYDRELAAGRIDESALYLTPANVIEEIKVNGTKVEPSNDKSVDITVPTNNNQLINGAGYLTSSDISGKLDSSEFDVHTATHAPNDAEKNVITSIKVNNEPLSVGSDRSVSITVPTNYLTASDITNKADKATTLAGYGITNAYNKDEMDELLNGKQGKLTFDSTPTSSSTNPVTSGGVYAALSSKADADSYLPLSGGTVTGNITFDNSTTSQKSEPYLQWAAYSSNKPYIGFAHDQTDGTFIICSMEKDTTTNGVKYYKNGLAIGGGSGNLFWKGEKVATAADLALKADLASPIFTGTPKAPTASAGTNTTQIATTAFVTTAITNAIGNAIAASY